MKKSIQYLDNIIRAVSENIYYKKNKLYDKTDRICEYVSEELQKLVVFLKEINDEKLQQQFMELMEKNDVYGGEFLKIVCKIKEYILSKYKTDASLYCGKNLDLLLKKDKKLYEYVIDSRLSCGSEERKYQIDWNRIFDISMIIEKEKREKINICSFGNPWQEALLYAHSINDNADVCIIFGFGLGYHIQEMAAMYPNMEIYVLENDIEQIRTAINYRNMTDILANRRIHIILQ